MKTSGPPVDIRELATWFISRADYESFDLEGAQHFIQAFIACGAHKEASTFVRRLLPAPVLFAECAITLIETLCEYERASFARTIIPWFERRMHSDQHNLKPCDLYIAITEFSRHEIDIAKALEAILKEPDFDERALRLIGTADRIPDRDVHLAWVRSRIEVRRLSDPKAAHSIAYPLVGITHLESDFATLCEITRDLVHHLQQDEYLLFVAQLQEIGSLIPKPAVQRVIKRGWSPPIMQRLEQILANKQNAPTGIVRH